MDCSPVEAAAARSHLVEEIRLLVNTTGTMEDSLERSVRKLTRIMRRDHAPPEQVVIAVKNAFYHAGMGPRLVQWDKAATQPVIAKLVTWCVDAYYEEDGVTTRPSNRPAGILRGKLRLISDG
jgi:hypothetical protein